jgi:hypothetical protein
MEHQSQHVLLGRAAEDGRPQRDLGRQVELVRNGLVDRGGDLVGRHVDHRHLRCGVRHRQDPLVGLTLGVRQVDGAQDLVAADHIADCRHEGVLVQGPREPERGRHVVGLGSRLQLVQEPHTALRK